VGIVVDNTKTDDSGTKRFRAIGGTQMSEGPLFPKKTSEEGQEEAPPVVIERSDDPDFGKTTSTGRRAPSLPGRPTGCSTQVFIMLLVGLGLLAYGLA
jgi:hypothetical protein